jgi:tetratricopeptide (TPR) repeat protein
MVLLVAGPAFAAILEYDEYLERANAARSRGDWESAASQFAQAINHPDLPRDGAMQSAVHREYGRAIGVLCHYEEAEKYLLRAKAMAGKTSSAMIPALYELGAINVAQKKFSAATGYFSELLPMIDRESRDGTPPLVVADAYEKFAVALAATGKPEEAELRRREADRIRETHPKAVAPGTITPYGTQCRKS